ncbi:C6 finger domain protein, putative [Talaromyces stipitatus ATCC 10500]|uniref:C6 finger domain protein, putative n=1 Tax=Talaromyces stipitatus (strain ATCC 10500 / CBS 375.48 / QM 6759 / NRRL 1006) TaxID=441959 RepID=B8MP07_TALSN|nr:C6 finger domain protein, putative [Talaromyces stipitatus ATCC 10500]EED14246.1 C6 finger domain protein, putative [Talaromyces stipitatus ATCC 10500]
MRGVPWTMHLEGIYNILCAQGFQNMNRENESFRNHLVEVMGVMDMSVFILGRQTPYFGIWRQHRHGPVNMSKQGDVETVTGLPRSLLDLYSGIGETTSEQDLWNWPGEKGNLLQCQLWEAHRLSAILNRAVAHRIEHRHRNPCHAHSQLSDAILRAHIDMDKEAEENQVVNALNYPALIAAQEVEILRNNPDSMSLIRRCLQSHSKAGFGSKLLLNLLVEFWEFNDPNLDLDSLASFHHVEAGIL